MGLFTNRNANQNVSERQQLAQKYNGARSTLLFVLLFSVINIVLLFGGGESYFLFSAFIPYIISIYGMLFTNRLPAEIWGTSEVVRADSFLYTTLAIAGVLLLVYLLSWIFSKKKKLWMTIALVFFVIDTLGLVVFTYQDIGSKIIDYVFHGLVIYSMISGLSAHKKLAAMPEEVAAPAPEDTYAEIEPVDDVQ